MEGNLGYPRVSIVRTEEEFEKVAIARSQAYLRHIPTIGNIFESKDLYDTHPANLTLRCYDAQDNTLGGIRITLSSELPLPIEQSLDLPEAFIGQRNAEFTRFFISARSNALHVRNLLIKASFLYCQAHQVRFAIAGARAPVNKIYEQYCFRYLTDPPQLYPNRNMQNLPHYVLYADIPRVESAARAVNHVHHRFFFETYHPEIEIFSSLSTAWANPRRAAHSETVSRGA